MFKEMAPVRVAQALVGGAGRSRLGLCTLIAALWAATALGGCDKETIDLLPPPGQDASLAGQPATGFSFGGAGGTGMGGYHAFSSSGGSTDNPWSPGLEGSPCQTAGDCIPGLVCEPFSGRCVVPCTTPDDCEGDHPLCDRQNGSVGRCVDCLSNLDCEQSFTGSICLAGSCVQCVSDGDCEEPNAHCDRSFFICRHCLTDDHCPEPYHCDQRYFQCQECTEQAHCPDGTYCDTNRDVCEECLTNAHCPADSYCDLTSFECVPWQ